MYSRISLENQKIYTAKMLTGDTVNKITPIDVQMIIIILKWICTAVYTDKRKINKQIKINVY